MEKRNLLYPLLVFGGLLVACFVFLIVLIRTLDQATEEPHAWTSGKGPKIGVVELTGVISQAKPTIAQLIRFRRDKEIQAIVLRIDSPGGSVAPSQEIFQEVRRTRKDKKVVVSMGTVAASGGYYVASAADRIYASAGTITGSIGVISEFVEVDRLLDLLHVETNTIKSGALKDVGSPFRPMSDDDKRFLQQFVDRIYDQFLTDVSAARKLDRQELKKIADGRILTGEEAKAAGLVDEIGNLAEAIEGAARLAGAKPEAGEPVPVFSRPKRSPIAELLHDGAEALVGGARESLRSGASVEARDARLR